MPTREKKTFDYTISQRTTFPHLPEAYSHNFAKFWILFYNLVKSLYEIRDLLLRLCANVYAKGGNLLLYKCSAQSPAGVRAKHRVATHLVDPARTSFKVHGFVEGPFWFAL